MFQFNTCGLSQKIIEFEFYIPNKKFFEALDKIFHVPGMLNCGVLHGYILELISYDI